MPKQQNYTIEHRHLKQTRTRAAMRVQQRLFLRFEQLLRRADINQPASTDLGSLQAAFGDQSIKLGPPKPRRLAGLGDGAGHALKKLHISVR